MKNKTEISQVVEGDRYLVIDPPLIVEIFEFDAESEVELDFGMNISFGAGNLEGIRRELEFDLCHAFFHPPDDPNYAHYHWALYGNLKDRVTIFED